VSLDDIRITFNKDAQCLGRKPDSGINVNQTNNQLLQRAIVEHDSFVNGEQYSADPGHVVMIDLSNVIKQSNIISIELACLTSWNEGWSRTRLT
jgi:hypothetical protein